ncbi:MAG: MBL fold metallo-hydrolase [Nitrososphaerota archaeon]|nr:MBL fold metallo-hydrolase [Nitrososphaerota archaeon]
MTAVWVTSRTGMIDTGGYGGDETVASYVVKGSNGSALVDVGYSTNWESVMEGMGTLGVSPDSVRHVFLTHFHLDHAGALGELMPRLPNATVVAHEKALRHLIEPSRLVAASMTSFGKAAQLIGSLSPIQPDRLEPAREEAYDLGGVKIQPVFTPGHVPSHTSFFTDDGTMFSGDAICVTRKGLRFLLPPGSPPVYDVGAAVRSVELIQGFKPRLLLAPHFGPQPTSKEAFERQTQTMRAWLDSISSMVEQGMGLGETVDEMRERSLREAGLKSSGLDGFARDILLGPLLGMTVEAYMAYALSGETRRPAAAPAST